MDTINNHKFAVLSEKDIQEITSLEKKLSTGTGDGTILIAYSKNNS